MPERDKLIPATAETRVGALTPNTISMGRCLGSYKSISALNYGARPKPGEYRCNPVTIYNVVASSTPMPKVTHYYAPYTYTAMGDLAAHYAALKGYSPKGVYLLPSYSTQLEQFTINKAYAKLMKADLDIGIMLGELRETIEGLRNPISALRNFLKKYPLPKDFFRLAMRPPALKDAAGKGRDTLDMLSGSWLEWRYGIRPLLKDLTDIIEHIKTQSRDFDDKMQKRGGKSPISDKLTTSSGWMSIGDWQFWCTMIVRTVERYSASVCFNYTAPLTWQETYGLDLSSIPGIAWELTRLSFVADWFISIGTWLESLKALSPKVQVQGVSVTQRVDRYVDVSITKATCRGQTASCVPSSYHLQMEYMKRKCVPPGFSALTPALNPRAFDITRSLDALTLLWQRLPRK